MSNEREWKEESGMKDNKKKNKGIFYLQVFLQIFLFHALSCADKEDKN